MSWIPKAVVIVSVLENVELLRKKVTMTAMPRISTTWSFPRLGYPRHIRLARAVPSHDSRVGLYVNRFCPGPWFNLVE
jgi:hypothetical protein